jgi:hypothetical protein
MSTQGTARLSFGAFGFYLVASALLFGLPVLSDPGHRFIGPPFHPDPRFFFWALAWWPHALARGMNPIWTHAVWAPGGYNLAWATGVPGPSLLMAPITIAAGPVVAYNALALLSCPLSAFASFVLCRRITGAFWPSLAGGWIFGFSTYQLGHLGLHVNLELAFMIPLAVYLVLRRVDGDLSSPRFVAGLTVVLVLLFLTSTELFATLALFGAVTLVLAIALGPAARRASLLDAATLVGLSFVLAAIVVSPYLWYAFAHGVPRRDLDGSDLLSLVLPRLRTRFGSHAFFAVTRKFPGTSVENTAYVGLPLLGALGHFAVTEWRRWTTRLLVIAFGLIAVATLGPRLFVAGHASIPLPWRIVRALPVINNASPRRFTVYLFLIAAVTAALWLRTGVRSWARWATVGAAGVFLFPNFSPGYLHGSAEIPTFFSSGEYMRFVAPGQNVLILPIDAPSGYPQAISMVIQARTDFRFPMALAYTGPPPPEYYRSPIIRTLYRGSVPAVGTDRFRRFLTAHQIRAAILDRSSPIAPQLTALLETAPTEVQDVLVYRVQPP